MADGPSSDLTEREVKLAVDPGFELPDLGGLADGVTVAAAQERSLDATYYDTPDLRLARDGVTVRYRAGDGTGWTVKLPARVADASAMVRRELTFEGARSGDGGVPDPVADVTTAWVRASSLGPVARLRSRRRSTALTDADGRVVAEIDDDEVTVGDDDAVTARFREVEAEVVGDGVPVGLLDALVDRLRRAGATDADPVPKVVRALGARAAEPPDLAVATVGEDATAGEVVGAALVRAARRIVDHDALVRLGDDADAVRAVRTGARRMRSTLSTFAAVVDGRWGGAMAEDLSWLLDLVRPVSRCDAVLERLSAGVGALEQADRVAADALVSRLAERRVDARTALLAGMRGERYAVALDRIVEGARSPSLVPSTAGRVAAEVLPGLVAAPWRELREAAGALGAAASEGDVRRVRRLARRVRHGAEAAVPVVGKPAKRLARALRRAEDPLATHLGARATEAWLRGVVDDLEPSVALVAGRLVAGERSAADAALRGWPAAWARVDRKKRRRWLEP